MLSHDELDELRSKKVFVLDMDGTFYLGNQLISGSLELIRALEQKGKTALFFTNNSSQSAAFYRRKIGQMGLESGEVPIYTSGDVLVYYLQKHYPGKRVYLVGTSSLEETLRQQDIVLANDEELPAGAGVDLVVAGFDTTLEYHKVERACAYLRRGAVFLATNPDLNCPTEQGFLPDCGSICAMLTAATGKKPLYLGKPYATTLDFLVRVTGYQPAEMVIVGDRVYTDIAFGKKNGITAVLVLSGETRPADWQKLLKADTDPTYRADYVFPSLAELGAVL